MIPEQQQQRRRCTPAEQQARGDAAIGGPPSSAEPTAAPFQQLDKTKPRPYPRVDYARRAVWGGLWRTIYRCPRAFALRRQILRWMGARVAESAIIHASARIYYPWLLQVGQHSTIARDVEIYNLGPVAIGDHTIISQYAYLCAGTHDYTRPDLPLLRPPIRIGNGVWVAAGAFIGPGVTIGDNSVVAARAVVVKDVPPGVVVGGNPARVLKPRTMHPLVPPAPPAPPLPPAPSAGSP